MHPTSSRNPNPNPAQALHFLRLLSTINRPRGMSRTRAPPAETARHRSRRIRLAAYASMAYAVGQEKAWSRALLRRLRGRSAGGTTTRARSAMGDGEDDQATALRRIVPGGRRMDLCRLLEETGHYIQCLTSQVEVMQRVADLCEA